MTDLIRRSMRNSQLAQALLAAFYFFLIMCSYYMLKPLRDSSFLSEFHANAKPLFNLITMAILFFAASLYSSVVKKVQGISFIRLFYGFVFLNLAAFWMGIEASPRFAGALFYAWLSCANVFLVTVFWTQINSSFSAKKDKFLYVIIGLGGGIGAAFGGEITENIVPYIGPNNLIFAAGGILFIAFLCSLFIARRTGQETFVIPEPEKDLSNFRGLLKNRYAVCLLVLVVIGTFVQTIYDYQLTTMVEHTIGKDKAALAVFYGGLYSRLNTFSFLAQILIGPLVLMSIGPARGMYVLLALILGSSAVLALNNSLPVMEWVFIVFAGSGYSVVQMFREQLYLPASPGVKVSSKGFIDTFGYRAGDAVAAICFVVVVTILGFDVVRLDYFVMGAGIVAAYYLYKANEIYGQIIRDAETEPVPVPVAEKSTQENTTASGGFATLG